jgi:hypothetical protein
VAGSGWCAGEPADEWQPGCPTGQRPGRPVSLGEQWLGRPAECSIFKLIFSSFFNISSSNPNFKMGY